MHDESIMKIMQSDAVLVLNKNPKLWLPSYIGEATFLEMYDAYLNGLKIFMLSKIVQDEFADEVEGLMDPTIISGRSEIK